MTYYIKNPQNDSIDNLLDSWLQEMVNNNPPSTQRNSNTISTEDFVEIQIETTGLTKEDVIIDMQDGILSVSYDHKDVKQVQYTQQQIFIDSFTNKYKLKNHEFSTFDRILQLLAKCVHFVFSFQSSQITI